MRRRSAGLAVTCGSLIALFGAACGSVEEAPEAEKREAPAQTGATTRAEPQAEGHRGAPKKGPGEGPQAVDADGDTRSWAWFTAELSVPSESNAPPLVGQLSVFSRPRRTTDAVPRDAVELVERAALAREEFEGRALLDQSRLVIANAGSRNVDIYLVPTTKGFVCSYVVDPTDELAGGLGGCDHALAPEGYTVGMSGTERRLEVEGLVADSVRRVEVEVWARSVEAEVAGNAYYLDTTVDRSCPAAVGAIVLHSSGEARRIELDHPVPPPSAAGEAFRMPGCR